MEGTALWDEDPSIPSRIEPWNYAHVPSVVMQNLSYVQALNGEERQAEGDPNVQDSEGSISITRAYMLNILWGIFDLLYLSWFRKQKEFSIWKKSWEQEKQFSFIAEYHVCLTIWNHYIDRPWKAEIQCEMEPSWTTLKWASI